LKSAETKVVYQFAIRFQQVLKQIILKFHAAMEVLAYSMEKITAITFRKFQMHLD